MKTIMLSMAMAFIPAAYAQTWVSASIGNDANNCTRTSPCLTFQRAVSMTPVWGQLNVLDPGNYGAVIIQQSMTIDGGGFASTYVTSGTGITVNAPGGVVQLRNLSIHGNGATLGIYFVAGAQLHIENVKVNGISGTCIDASPSGTGNSDLVIKDTSIENCSNSGIYLSPASGVVLSAEISNTHVHYANAGLLVNNGLVTVTGSSFSSPATLASDAFGIISSTGGSQFIMVDDCRISGFYIAAYAAAGTIQFSRSTFTDNNIVLNTVSGAAAISNGNNSFLHNAAFGNNFTQTVALK